jgi:ATP-dependent Zn protease
VNRAVRSWLFPIVVLLALVWLVATTLTGNSSGSSKDFRFSDALALVRENPEGIEYVTFHPSSQKVDFRLATGKTRTTAYPVDRSAYALQQLLEEKGVAFEAMSYSSSPVRSILTSLLPFVLLFGFWIFLTRSIKQKPVTERDAPETPTRY